MSETPDPAESEDAAAQPPAAETTTRHGAFVGASTGDGIEVLHASADDLIDVVTALRAEGYGMLLDLTAVDYLMAYQLDDHVVTAQAHAAAQRGDVVLGGQEVNNWIGRAAVNLGAVRAG